MALAHPAGDQLGILGTEVDDEGRVVAGVCRLRLARRALARRRVLT
jgi:hypothetical protein